MKEFLIALGIFAVLVAVIAYTTLQGGLEQKCRAAGGVLIEQRVSEDVCVRFQGAMVIHP